MAAVIICSDSGAQKIKSDTVSTVSHHCYKIHSLGQRELGFYFVESILIKYLLCAKNPTD